jgi:hypothetical protein
VAKCRSGAELGQKQPPRAYFAEISSSKHMAALHLFILSYAVFPELNFFIFFIFFLDLFRALW